MPKNQRLFVNGLSYNTSNEDLRQLFEDNSVNVVDAKVVTDRETGRSRGHGFVDVDEATNLKDVVKSINGSMFDGRTITVSEKQLGMGYGGNQNVENMEQRRAKHDQEMHDRAQHHDQPQVDQPKRRQRGLDR